MMRVLYCVSARFFDATRSFLRRIVDASSWLLPVVNRLVKLVMFSAGIHTACFTALSGLKFAVGSVQVRAYLGVVVVIVPFRDMN